MSTGSAGAHSAWLQVKADSVSVRVRAKPGSSRRGLIPVDADVLVVGLGAPPEKGRANEELIELLARAAGVSRSSVKIVRGSAAREKLVAIATSDPAATSARLVRFASGSS